MPQPLAGGPHAVLWGEGRSAAALGPRPSELCSQGPIQPMELAIGFDRIPNRSGFCGSAIHVDADLDSSPVACGLWLKTLYA